MFNYPFAPQQIINQSLTLIGEQPLNRPLGLEGYISKTEHICNEYLSQSVNEILSIFSTTLSINRNNCDPIWQYFSLFTFDNLVFKKPTPVEGQKIYPILTIPSELIEPKAKIVLPLTLQISKSQLPHTYRTIPIFLTHSEIAIEDLYLNVLPDENCLANITYLVQNLIDNETKDAFNDETLLKVLTGFIEVTALALSGNIYGAIKSNSNQDFKVNFSEIAQAAFALYFKNNL